MSRRRLRMTGPIPEPTYQLTSLQFHAKDAAVCRSYKEVGPVTKQVTRLTGVWDRETWRPGMIRHIKFSPALNNQGPKAASKGEIEMKRGDVCFMTINVEGRLHVSVWSINSVHKAELVHYVPADYAECRQIGHESLLMITGRWCWMMTTVLLSRVSNNCYNNLPIFLKNLFVIKAFISVYIKG